jgi:VanZ family protein
MRVSPMPMRGSPLARLLAVVYVLLTAYASLYPLQGWRDPGVPALAYLAAPWPRYITLFDLGANLLGYVPLGVLVVLALYPGVRGAAALGVAAVTGTALSLALEAGQSFLPARIPSNLDVACNLIGVLAGAALGVRLAPWLLERSPLRRLRDAAFPPGALTDAGLVLLGLWLFTQLNPAMLLFGVGDLRDLLAVPAGRARTPEFFVLIEALAAATNLLAVALLLSVLAIPGRARVLLSALVAAALLVKSAAFAILMQAESALGWLTAGAQQGLAAGFAAALLAVSLPRSARLAVAAVLLMAGTVLVNLAPPNPYFADTLRVWQQGHFLNFNGLTRLVSAAWPFAALAYLTLLAARRPRDALG